MATLDSKIRLGFKNGVFHWEIFKIFSIMELTSVMISQQSATGFHSTFIGGSWEVVLIPTFLLSTNSESSFQTFNSKSEKKKSYL